MRKITKIVTVVMLLTAVTMVSAQSGAATRGRGAANFTLTINSNVANATVILNGDELKDPVPLNLTLARGTYNIQVRAPGYRDFIQSVDLSSNQTINANLQLITHTLTINSNVAGAQVLIDNQDRGTVTFRDNVRPGAYTITVRAPGYIEFSQRTNVQNDTTISAQLQPATARVSLSIPGSILDQTVSNPAGQVQVFVDGNAVTGSSFDVQAGRRTIRVRSGGFSAEITRDFTAGAQYSITPSFSVQVQ